jgi:hypothetical protein
MKSAVEAGLAKVVKGVLPEVIEGKVKKNFITSEPETSDSDKLTAALERQSVIMEKLLARLAN